MTIIETPEEPRPEDVVVSKPRKEKTKKDISLFLTNAVAWGWFKSGTCKARLYIVKLVSEAYRLAVADFKKKQEYQLMMSLEPIDLVTELSKTSHVLVGKVHTPKPPKKKKGKK